MHILSSQYCMTHTSKQNLEKTICLLLETQESKLLVSVPESTIHHTT